MPEKISAIIITLNEEKNIGRCLEAVSKVADEIVVVDSFSTDDTEKICSTFETKFFQHKFEGYIEQKDYARSLASHDLILSVDADEVLSDELIESIKKIKQNPKYKAYKINRLSYYVDRFIYHGHWFPDKKIRLFKKDAGDWGGRNPHDQFILKNNERAPMLKGVLYHYTFKSISEHLRQANKFSDIGAKELASFNSFFLAIKAIISPSWGFFYGYFVKLGFLDGWYGLTIALISSMESYLKYSKAIVAKRQPPDSELSIIHLSSITKWRGGEQQVINLVEQLCANGIYNHLVVARKSELAKYCKKQGLPYTTINYLNGFNIVAAWKLKRLSKRLQADIVHMHCSPSHTLGIISNVLGNKTSLILTRRVIYPIKSSTLSRRKYNYQAIERIICVSKAIKDVLQKQIYREDIFRVVYDGVDINKITSRNNGFALRTEYNLHDKILVSIIAALSPEKDHFTFLKAAKILLVTNKDFHFLIVGEGKEKESIKAYIDEHNLTANVTMTGFRKDIPKVLQESNYFTLTSTEEGLGSSILEAFANKTPVIATAAGGIPELVVNGETGLLAKKGDAEAIAEHIMALENDNTLKQSLVKNAFEALNNKFRIEISARQTTDIYRGVVGKEKLK